MEMSIKASTMQIINPLYPLHGIFIGTADVKEELN
jgi:hypothetical protein